MEPSDSSVATVSDTGSVLGVKNGTAVITATVKGYPNVSASCTVSWPQAQIIRCGI